MCVALRCIYNLYTYIYLHVEWTKSKCNIIQLTIPTYLDFFSVEFFRNIPTLCALRNVLITVSIEFRICCLTSRIEP